MSSFGGVVRKYTIEGIALKRSGNMFKTFQYISRDVNQKNFSLVEQAIDEEIDNPNEGRIVKLFVSNREFDEIANIEGVSSEAVSQIIKSKEYSLQNWFGCPLKDIRKLCLS
jgi:hypothetical protein